MALRAPRRARSRRTAAASIEVISRKLQRALSADPAPITPGPVAPEESAALARLRYVAVESPGLGRVRAGRAFRYIDVHGEPVTDERTLARIRALAIPPAWTNVWICPSDDGHIQALGRDARGRKQYRYHPRWREIRDRTKFGRMVAFGRALPRIRRAVRRDLDLAGLPREKVLATVVELLDATGIRVGNDEYARSNRHFGLTTLHNKHVDVSRGELRFRFTGKSGKAHELDLRDARLARIVLACQEIPGQRLFQYVDGDGERHAIDSNDVNDYLRSIAGGDFTAKDFRTWVGTVTVAGALLACQSPTTVKETRTQVLAALDVAAERLGNTRAICRSSYVHPAVLAAFEEGRLVARLRGDARVPRRAALDPLEATTLRVLEAAARRPRLARAAGAT